MANHRILAGLLAICLAAGCKAQTQPQAMSAAELQRRIEVLVRSQFSVSPDVNVSIGARAPSKFNGYDNLSVTFTKDSISQKADFLISTDNRTLVHMTSYNLENDPVFSIDVAGRPIRGNPNAKVTVINFDDLECAFCARMHEELFPDTMEHYKNQVRFIYKDSPLSEIHPWAMHAAVDANCLAAQSGAIYWTYIDYIHGHEDEVTGEDRDMKKSFATLDRVAREEAVLEKLDSGRLDECMAKQDETKIVASRKEGEALGVDGTPALFVDGEKINGLVSKQTLWIAIDRALRAAGEQPPLPPAPAPAPQSAKNGQ